MQFRQFDPLILPNIPSSSRVLVADAWDASPHIETGLEIALRLAPSYLEVAYIHYGDILPRCEYSSQSRMQWATNFAGINSTSPKRGIEAAKKFSALYCLNIRFIDASGIKLPDDFILDPEALESLESLQHAFFQGSNLLGISLVSSLVSITGNSVVNPSDHATLVENLATGFGRCYHLVSNLLDTGGYDALIIFNGRFASVKGAVLAASTLAKSIFFHERGCSMNKFSLKSYQPHDRIRFQEDIRENWTKTCKDSNELQIARDFFISNRSGKEQGWTSYKGLMEPGKLAPIIANAKSRRKNGKVICFFSSSEDEYVSTEGFYESSDFEWKGQDEAFRVLSRITDKHGYSLLIRIHPHLQQKADADRIKWDELNFLDDHGNITIIKSNSAVDSYELIDSCDLVVVYGSTLGIEALHWKKPVVVMSDTLYDEIGASLYKPLTISELDSLIGSIDSLSVVQESALPYGHYFSTFGISFQLYRPLSLFKGKFLGIDLNQRPWMLRLASGFKKILKKYAGGSKSLFSSN